jgi:hypothetical protein
MFTGREQSRELNALNREREMREGRAVCPTLHTQGAHGTPQQIALRCRIVLWRQRASEQRLDGLWEVAPGRGRKPKYDIDKLAAIVDATLQTKPEGETHWRCRTMAKSQGVSKSTI